MFKRVERIWGSWTEICRFKHLCIKILNFNKASHISKQRHQFRTELWFILDGCGYMITDKSQDMDVFESMKIKPMTWHQFITPYHKGCKVLEIQYGKEVRESDIERV